MGSKGKKALLVLVLVAMLSAAGFIIYASRQMAAATDNPNTHAGRIERATRQVERALNR